MASFNYGNSVLILSETNPNKLIAVHRPEAQDQLCLPGGRQEIDDEDSIAGAIREVFEETGIVLEPEDLKPIHSGYCVSQGVNYWVTIYIAYLPEDTEFTTAEDNLFPHWIERDDFMKKTCYSSFYKKAFDKLPTI